MIFTRVVDNETWYHVCNDFGDSLIYTRNSRLAHYVHNNSKGIPRGLYLTIGGDPQTHLATPLWQFRRLA
jgi:hypothetical protein